MPRMMIRNLKTSCAAAAIGLILLGSSRAEDSPKTPRHPANRGGATSRTNPTGSSSSSTGFWLSTGGVAVALAVFGAYSLAAKKVRPAGDSPSLRVIARTNLSPRQSVYLVRVGDRTLIVGTGHQGPPSLLGELTESPISHAAESAVKAPHIAPMSRIGGSS